MVKIKQTVLMATCGRGEDGTLDAVWALERKKDKITSYFKGQLLET